MMRFIEATCAILILIAVTGCSVGMAPAGMSREEARAALDKLSPQERIRYYSTSPMPQSEKLKKYEEIEKATGVKASDVLGGGMNPTGQGQGEKPGGAGAQ